MTPAMPRGWKAWLLYVGLWTLLALFFTSQTASQVMLYPDEYPNFRWGPILAQSFVNWFTWGLLTLGVLRVVSATPITRAHVGRVIATFLPLGLACVAVRVTVNWLFSLAWPAYFGDSGLRTRLFMQSHWNLFIFAAILGAVIAYDVHRRYREREVRAAQLETKLARTQLQVLRMQLQPHFLFNTLHGISTLMHRDVEAADAMLTQLSELLRIAMTNEGDQETSLKRELDFLERYVQIQQTRFGERLRVDMQVEPEVLDAMVPTLLLQPLVENAIRHGVGPRAVGGHVAVSAKRANGSLLLEVSDDGPGLADGTVPRHGVGLANTRARLEQLYGAAQRMELTRGRAGGLAVRLTIPFRASPEPAAQNGDA